MDIIDIKYFESPQFGTIRTAGTPEEPLFCLTDVCRALGLGNPSMVKERLYDPHLSTIEAGVRTGTKADGSPSIQRVKMLYMGEPNLYRCIFQSRKQEAEAFQEWICCEVLPEIRKSGKYSTRTGKGTESRETSKSLSLRLQAAKGVFKMLNDEGRRELVRRFSDEFGLDIKPGEVRTTK